MVSGQWRKQRERTAGAEGLADVFFVSGFFFFLHLLCESQGRFFSQRLP